ncbi:MAG: 16S rRNA (guanine(966)-N(2))-methyltransferase RsmD [Bacteroidota bacterium]
MRIITGSLKGRKIPHPQTQNVRPTTDRTKEGMFNAIVARRHIRGLRVLDLFAGTGNLTFEAISRGAESALCVDSQGENLEYIQELADKFGVSDQIRTRRADVAQFLEGPPIPFDLIFCDPPYEYPLMHDMVEQILEKGWLAPDGWLVLEHDRRHHFEHHPHSIYSKPYGRTIVVIFERPEDSNFSEEENQAN